MDETEGRVTHQIRADRWLVTEVAGTEFEDAFQAGAELDVRSLAALGGEVSGGRIGRVQLDPETEDRYLLVGRPVFSEDGSRAVVALWLGPHPHGCLGLWVLQREPDGWDVVVRRVTHFM